MYIAEILQMYILNLPLLSWNQRSRIDVFYQFHVLILNVLTPWSQEVYIGYSTVQYGTV